MAKVVNYADQLEMIAWVGLLLGFYMFLRKSNLVPDSMDKFDSKYQFTKQDVNISNLDKPMMFEIRWSKTIQLRHKVLRLPVLPAKNKWICPVFWVHKLLTDIPAPPQFPLLALPVRGQILSLSANQLIYRFRKWLQLIGKQASAFSLHSLRRGGTIFAYESNMEAEMICTLGDWSSDAYKRYIDLSMDKRYEFMKEFVDALNKMTC